VLGRACFPPDLGTFKRGDQGRTKKGRLGDYRKKTEKARKTLLRVKMHVKTPAGLNTSLSANGQQKKSAMGKRLGAQKKTLLAPNKKSVRNSKALKNVARRKNWCTKTPTESTVEKVVSYTLAGRATFFKPSIASHLTEKGSYTGERNENFRGAQWISGPTLD